MTDSNEVVAEFETFEEVVSVESNGSLVLKEIVAWSDSLPYWQNESLRLLFQRGSLGSDEINYLYSVARIEEGVEEGTLEIEKLKEFELPLDSKPNSNSLICQLTVQKNVNALKNGVQLKFGPSLNVIYGDNGSGKTGFARLLKRACRARFIEPILPNVFSPSVPNADSRAQAVFELIEDDSSVTLPWTDGDEALSSLSRFIVFDSNCGKAYVSEKNTAPYLAFGLDVVENLGKVVDDVRVRFLQDGNSVTENIDSIVSALKSIQLKQLLAQLQPESWTEKLATLKYFDLQLQEKLVEGNAKLLDYKSKSSAARKLELNECLTYFKNIESYCRKLLILSSGESIDKIHGHITNMSALFQASAVNSENLQRSAELPGFGTEAWRNLLLAAENYSLEIAFKNQTFPNTDKCVLCQQELLPDANERLNRFWNFIHDDINSKLRIHQEQLSVAENEIIAFLNIKTEYLSTIERVIVEVGVGSFEDFKQFLDEHLKLLKRLLNDIQSQTKTATKLTSDIPSIIAQIISDVESKLNLFVDDVQLSAAIALLEEEVSNLTDRKLISANFEKIEKHFYEKFQFLKFSKVASTINTRNISQKSKELQKKYVTETFKILLENEFKNLNVNVERPVVTITSEAGKVHRRLGLRESSTSLDKVFSEGERNSIALSYFMAEIQTSESSAGVIFDDPVSSLDHNAREHVVKRIIAFAKTRQVIVFTHDLVFFRELVGNAERAKLETKISCISSRFGSTGHVSEGPPWDATPVTERLAFLQSLIKECSSMEKPEDFDKKAYERIISDYYSRLRACWERSTEEFVLNKVVQRFERTVNTSSLDGVVADDDAVESVISGMNHLSERIKAHDHACAAGSSNLTTKEMQEDLRILEEFVKVQKAKRKLNEAKFKHLKAKA